MPRGRPKGSKNKVKAGIVEKPVETSMPQENKPEMADLEATEVL